MSTAAPKERLPRGTAAGHRGAEPLTRSTFWRPALVLSGARRPRVPVAVGAVLIVLVGVVTILLANIAVSHTTFRVQSLSDQQAALQDERDRLVEDISYRESPQNIAEAAEEKGLVRDIAPSFLDMRTGEITRAEPAPSADPERTLPERIPGPRADARDDIRPNLRSDERLPVVGGGDQEFTAPAQRQPQD